MKKIFKEMGLSKFRQNSTFLFMVSDAWILGFLYKKFTNKETMDQLIQIAARQQQLNQDHIEQLYQLLTQSLILMLILVALIHIMNYVLYNKNKKMAFAYLHFYSWSAGIGCPLWGLSLVSEQLISGLIFIAVGGFFLFNALGLKHFPHVPVKKT